ncbi:MAG: hypothetical protein H6816_05335 [Phycisphaerales bacterium]|nr:hypothetical protein [Phycisphaerales bacterium]
MTRIRIASDGTVRGLWTDDVVWRAIGQVAVRRASHVEFSTRRQLWYVRDGRVRNALTAIVQFVLRRPCGKILHWASSRSDALAWEAAHFGVGGPGWAHRSRQRNAVS